MKPRRIISAALLCLFIWSGIAAAGAAAANGRDIEKQLVALEEFFNGRLGVVLLDAQGNALVSYRADERFPLCSTFKAVLAAAVLKRNEVMGSDLMSLRISYDKSSLVAWSPVTEKAASLTVRELCAAAVQYSDNTAANLLLELVGGPPGLTAFARSIGDEAFSQDRPEPALNEALPGDERDTTTPAAMAWTLRELALGDVLSAPDREVFVNWLKSNAVGADAIRAGVPPGWVVADKTGSGGYGTANDIAILWPPAGGPLILTVYTTQGAPDAKPRRDVIAEVARLLTEHPAAHPAPPVP